MYFYVPEGALRQLESTKASGLASIFKRSTIHGAPVVAMLRLLLTSNIAFKSRKKFVLSSFFINDADLWLPIFPRYESEKGKKFISGAYCMGCDGGAPSLFCERWRKKTHPNITDASFTLITRLSAML